MTPEQENKALRKMLWLRHGCPPYTLYGDDGEMQCNNTSCMIDFKRDPIDTIKRTWRRHAERQIEAAGGIDTIIDQTPDQQAPMIAKTQDDR